MTTIINHKNGFILTTFNQTSHSTAGMKYSFGSSKRFKDDDKTIFKGIKGYDIPSTMGKRSAGIGLGRRTQLESSKFHINLWMTLIFNRRKRLPMSWKVRHTFDLQ